MKTRETILAAIKLGKGSQCLDGRDLSRLANFFPVSDWETMGLKLAEGAKAEDVKTVEFTEENVRAQLKKDVDFGFEKAINQRGISSGLMYEVVKMWMWVLDDELQNFSDDNYAQYGLPLFKAVAVKYGFENPIGDKNGDEEEFASS